MQESAQERVTKYCKGTQISCRGNQSKAELKSRLDKAKECVANRKQVSGVFAKAKAKLQSEPAKDIKPLAKKLHAHFVAGEPGHKEAIENFEATVKDCQQRLGPNR